MNEANANMKMLADKHDCHTMRIQIVNGTGPTSQKKENNVKQEFIIWGLTKGQSDPSKEKQLHTKSADMNEANANMEMLADKHGCHTMRIQIVNGTGPTSQKKTQNINLSNVALPVTSPRLLGFSLFD